MIFHCILLFATSSLADNLEVAGNRSKRGANDLELFEGDIMLTKQQVAMANKGLNPYTKVGARGLTKYNDRRWPGGVVYYTIDTRRPLKKAFIYSAMRGWEEKTCIRFKERTYQRDYIEFFVGKG